MKVLIIDRYRLSREMLQVYLEKWAGITTIATSAAIPDAYRILERVPVEVMIVDLEIASQSGFQGLASLRGLFPEVPVIVIGRDPSGRLVRAALDTGAAAFLSTDSAGEDLIRALRIVSAGNTYIDPTLAPALARGNRRSENERTPEAERYGRLSTREREIFLLLAQGSRSGAIAEQLGIARKTADAHRYHIMRKMELRNTTDLVRIALLLGLIPELHD